MEASGHEPVRKHWATEGELASSRESLLAIGGNASWNLINKVWKRAVMSPYASTGFSRLACCSSLMLFKYFSEEFGDQPDSLIMKAFAFADSNYLCRFKGVGFKWKS